MRLIALVLLQLAFAAPVHSEDGQCRTVADMAGAVDGEGWALTDDLTGQEASEVLAQFPQPLPSITDEVAIFTAPDQSQIAVIGLHAGCAVWLVRMRAAGTEI